MAALVAVGWAVGPPEDPEGWRADVRVAARQSGKRVRTGTARTDGGETRPWACEVEEYEALSSVMGGLSLKGLGAMAGQADGSNAGGGGGYIESTVSVTAGETLVIFVGGQGTGSAYGFGGGGGGGGGKSGGDSSDILAPPPRVPTAPVEALRPLVVPAERPERAVLGARGPWGWAALPVVVPRAVVGAATTAEVGAETSPSTAAVGVVARTTRPAPSSPTHKAHGAELRDRSPSPPR